MKVILKNYNERTGYYDGIAFVSEKGESKGSEENPFTGDDINKAMKKLEDEGLIKNGVGAIYVGRDKNDISEILAENPRVRIVHVE